MKIKILIVPLLSCLILSLLVSVWIHKYRDFRVEPRVAGLDGRPEPAAEETAAASNDLEGKLETFDGSPSASTASWPGFRGPQRNGVFHTDVELARQWAAQGPKKLWQLTLGEGYAAPAVHNGRVYLIDYDAQRQCDAIRCFSLDDGKEIWRYSYPVKIKRNHGMSRTVPAVNDDFVVTMGPRCHVTCLDAKTGELKWMLDLVKQFGTKEPLWYAGQCPLIVDNKAIIAPAGTKALMLSIDCASGDVAWTCPNTMGWQMTHCSILPVEFAGKHIYVYAGSGGVAAVDAENGQLLWQTSEWYLRVNVPTPVDAGQGRIFLSAGYNKGSMMLQMEEKDSRIEPQVLFKLPPEVFGADQQTPIFYNGYIYGVRPNEELVCMDLNGKVAWTSGSENKFGLGPYLVVNDLLYALNDEGTLSIIEAKPERFSLLAKAKVLEGHECWGPMAFADGRLLVRDLTTLVCLNVGE
ncbi:MAG: PQQ-like beta-propeller repeat protein [Planctomycetaceae bacterium]|nr:PQQ-like beta-propeller repeat protein [Planctomycetaceae bacterium]